MPKSKDRYQQTRERKEKLIFIQAFFKEWYKLLIVVNRLEQLGL